MTPVIDPNQDFGKRALLLALVIVCGFALSASAQSLTPLQCPLDGHFWEPEGLTSTACVNACISPEDHDSSGCSAGPGGGGGGIGGGGPPPGIAMKTLLSKIEQFEY